MKDTKPVLLVLGRPPDAWFDALASAKEFADLMVASQAEDVEAILPDAEIAFSWETAGRWLKSHWDKARNLKWVQSSSAGVEHLLFPDLVESAVTLTNGRGLYAQPLAEFVMFCVLFFAKNFSAMEQNRLARRWQSYKPKDVRGQTIGIVGLGGTGRAVARLARAFEMQVLATKKNINDRENPPLADELVPAGDWHTLLPRSDYVINALPATPETRGLFDESAFRTMKTHACFINVGRGTTVDERALVSALERNWIAGAGLDVFAQEPLPPESPLYELPNVILSPHCADITANYARPSARLLAENLKRYLEGRPLLNVVAKHNGY